MDKIQKALQKLNEHERILIKTILERLKAGDIRGMDITRLKGRSDIFRIRKGDIRIIYKKDSNDIMVLTIERRSEKTYRDF